jgi:choline-glycine betaine transporter
MLSVSNHPLPVVMLPFVVLLLHYRNSTEKDRSLAIPTFIFVIGTIYTRRVKYLITQNMSQTTMKLNHMFMKTLVHMVIIIVFLVISVYGALCRSPQNY